MDYLGLSSCTRSSNDYEGILTDDISSSIQGIADGVEQGILRMGYPRTQDQ